MRIDSATGTRMTHKVQGLRRWLHGFGRRDLNAGVHGRAFGRGLGRRSLRCGQRDVTVCHGKASSRGRSNRTSRYLRPQPRHRIRPRAHDIGRGDGRLIGRCSSLNGVESRHCSV